MQKIIFLLVTFLGLTFITQAQPSKKKTTLESMNLHGQVESVREVSYKAQKNGDNWETGEISGDTRILFNDAGNRRAEAWYYGGSTSPHTRFHFTYDADQNRIEYKYENADDFRNSTTKYKYDRNGEKVSSARYDSKDKLLQTEKYTYDENGNQILLERYDADDKLIKTIKNEYEYDSKDRIIKDKIYYDDKFYGYETYEYNTEGKMIAHMRFKPDGTAKGGDKNKYDEHENKVEWLSINGYSGRETKYTYTYVYDEHKNWIEKWQYEDDKLKYIIKRTINIKE
ncbi:MAG: hypothetical protein MK212_18400 [Saprospiraceae bacterium]|nr:hypothetical protein [Saprospiraceae bacterium]